MVDREALKPEESSVIIGLSYFTPMYLRCAVFALEIGTKQLLHRYCLCSAGKTPKQTISPHARTADDNIMNTIVGKYVRHFEMITTLLINLGHVYAHIISCRYIFFDLASN